MNSTAIVRACVRAIAVLLGTWPLSVIASPAYSCENDGSGAVDAILIESECVEESVSNEGANDTSSPSASSPAYSDYIWASVCVPFDPSHRGPQTVDCGAARNCLDQAERVWELWGRRPPPNAGWDLLGSQCFGRPPTVADAPRPTVTPALVLTALRRIGLPEVEARTQPKDKTLVNFDTIFYAEPQTFTRTITLLGQSVDVEAQPTRYVWHHGDGTSAATSSPGAPYPSKQVTHEYTDAHRTVQANVDVVYSARFRVGDGAWQDIAETVTIAGPPTPLRISEATAVLSGSYE